LGFAQRVPSPLRDRFRLCSQVMKSTGEDSIVGGRPGLCALVSRNVEFVGFWEFWSNSHTEKSDSSGKARTASARRDGDLASLTTLGSECFRIVASSLTTAAHLSHGLKVSTIVILSEIVEIAVRAIRYFLRANPNRLIPLLLFVFSTTQIRQSACRINPSRGGNSGGVVYHEAFRQPGNRRLCSLRRIGVG
jgi:hypothetical protein